MIKFSFACFTVIIALSITCRVSAQMLQPANSYELGNAPLWVKKLYGTNPNVFEIDKLYNDYYTSNNFVKSFYTQEFKRWRRAVGDFIDDNGFVDHNLIQEYREIRVRKKNANKEMKTGSWSVVGPLKVFDESGDLKANQTNVYSITQCAGTPTTMYCGTEPGEIYKSIDGGTNWSNVSLNLGTNWGTTAIAAHPSDPNVAYAGGGDILYKTIDGGASWTIALNSSALDPAEIFIHPGNPNIVMTTGPTGVHRTDDGGLSWVNLLNDPAYDIKSNPLNPDKLFLAMDELDDDVVDIFVSLDGGANWTRQSSGWYNSTDPDRLCRGARIAVTTADTSRVYVYLIGDSKPGDIGYIGLFRSDDGGYNWINPIGQIGSPYSDSIPNLARGSDSWAYHQGFYNCAIMASKDDPDQIVIGGLNMWRSNDAGVTFECVNGYQCWNYNMHVDMQDFRQFGNEYWATTDGGIYKSSDFFFTQPTVSMSGVHGSDFWGLGSGWNVDVLVGGLYHNGNAAYYQDYAAGEFLNLGGGEAPTGYVNPGQDRRVYLSDVGGRIVPENIGDPIIGASMGMAPNESYWAAESSEMEFHPNCHNIIYLGKDNQLFKSSDGGTLFTAIHTFSVGATVTYIEVSRDAPEVQYAVVRGSGSCTLHKTINEWNTAVNLALPISTSKGLIAIDPSNHNHIWIAFPYGPNGSKVYKSIDGGLNWTNITSTELNGHSIHSMTHIGGTDGGIYLGTNSTVFYKNNSMSGWQIDDVGLPVKISTDILKPFYRDGKIRMASYGKGIWESPLYESPSKPEAKIMANMLTALCEADTFYFDDHSMLNHSGATWSWTFENAHITSSTIRNPAVKFNSTGTFLVTLTVTNSGGQSDIDSLYINIETPIAAQLQEDFELSFPPNEWYGSSTGNINWEQTSLAGGFGSSANAMMVDNYNVYAWGNYCDVTAPLDFSAATSGWLSFDVAYARYSSVNKDSLEVLVSSDCGQSWTSVYFKADSDLPTAPDYSGGQFVPTAAQWRKDSVDLSAYIGNNNMRVTFRNYGGYGQALFVDNINLGGVSVTIPKYDEKFITVYPNPVSRTGEINIVTSDKGQMTFSLFNTEGKLKAHLIQSLENPVSIKELNLATGTYLYSVQTRNFFYKGKVLVTN